METSRSEHAPRTALNHETPSPGRPAVSVREVPSFSDRAKEVDGVPPGTERENALRELAQQWTGAEPEDAERWAAGLQDPAERQSALEHVCLKLSDRDSREAVAVAGRHELGGALTEALAARWAAADFPAAAAWVQTLPQDETREGLLARVAISQAAVDPAEAATLIAEDLQPGGVQEEAAMAVLHQWLGQDAPAARAWVDQFPESEFKTRAEEEVSRASSDDVPR
ncbi:hypothetical protein [Haloferula sargassicola]|uniref:hypothetical protein n=1 Tax=Haloferula sargassicola TaxID=490096 RepID=UPI0033654F40